MDEADLLLFIVSVYLIGIYIFSIIRGWVSINGGFDDLDGFIIFGWPVALLMVIVVGVCEFVSWIAEKVPNRIRKIVSVCFFCIYLPFRPFRIGMLIRKVFRRGKQ